VRVIRDFLTTNDGELCVSSGEYLQVLHNVDRYWVECKLDLRQGLLPSANVTPVKVPPLQDGQQICIVRSEYHTQHPGDMSLKKGDLVVTTGEEDENAIWIKGMVLIEKRTAFRWGSEGMFPINLCWQPDPKYYMSSTLGADKLGRPVEKYAQAKQSMVAQLQDELSLKIGQIVKITHIIDKDWYRGECAGSSGIFPASFVRIIDSFPGDVPTADSSSYRGAEFHQGHEYDNTQPAFKGLDEGLKAAFAPGSSTSEKKLLSHGARIEAMLENSLQSNKNCEDTGVGTDTFLQDKRLCQNLAASFVSATPSLSIEAEKSAPSQANFAHGYSNLSSSLSALKPIAQPDTTLHLQHNGYKNLAESLTSAMKTKKSYNNSSKQDSHSDLLSSNVQRYQNAEFGYVGQSVDVRPYAISDHTFVPQYENELGFSEGDMIFLMRHVDADWIEGEMDGQQGIFPKSYVDIIVDCTHNQEISNMEFLSFEQPETKPIGPFLLPSSFYRVAFQFNAETESDLSLSEGEVVKILSQNDENWCYVENSLGHTGQCPVNHLNTCPEMFSNSEAKFDIDVEELIRETKSRHGISRENKHPKINPNLKFFDPLCSPDEEMLQIETELIRKVNEKPSIPINHDVTIHRNINIDSLNEERPRHRFKSSTIGKEQSIDSFISQNLDGLNEIRNKNQTFPASCMPSSRHLASVIPFTTECSIPTKQRQSFQISNSVREELMDKKNITAPPRPSKGPQIKMEKQQVEIHSSPVQIYEDINSSINVSKDCSVEEEIKTGITRNFDQSQCSLESLYAKVNKNYVKKIKNKTSLSQSYSAMDTSYTDVISQDGNINMGIPPASLSLDRLDLSYKDVRPVVPLRLTRQASVPTPCPVDYGDPKLISPTTGAAEQSRVPKTTQSNNGSVIPTDSSCIIYEELPSDVSYTVTVEINYDATEDTIKDVNSSSPSIYEHGSFPSTSTHNQTRHDAKPCQVNSPDDFICTSPFIPKRTTSIFQRFQSAFGRTETFKSYIQEFPPDKEAILSPHDEPITRELPPRPLTTPLKTRSLFYNSVLSDRSTPSLPSLAHSYETLNVPESVDLNFRMPHRPAPPVPTGQNGDYISQDQDKKSKERKEKDRKTLRTRKINSLRQHINIKEKKLEEQLLLELDMYQDIAVAKGSTYDTLNKRMDRCQENIETISDDIQRLQACLADEEMKLEDEKIDDLTRREEYESIKAQLKAKRLDEERKAEEEKRRRNKERRENVMGELVITEREYCRDLKLMWQAFNLECPELLNRKGIEVQDLFGNIADVIDISEGFLDTLQLEVKSKADPGSQMVGCCFLQHAETMKSVYTQYCLNHDKAEQLMEKYESLPEVQRVLIQGIETLRNEISCFNMGSILIKPVQRILKYPLILNELLKCTENDHQDKNDLKEAMTIMSDVAAFINESKRKKDIVEKYKAEEDTTLSRKICKFNMHSIGKKSSRISQKLLTSLGMDSMNKDAEFEELEKRFSFLTNSVADFCQNLRKLKGHLHETTVSQFNIAENVADLYKEKQLQIREVERFRMANRHVISTIWNKFNVSLEERVVKPLQQLLDAFHSPGRLIQKRMDKMLDYSSASQKAEKNRDTSKNRILAEELEKAKATYVALNGQLVDELPLLIQLSTDVYNESVSQYALARQLFVGRVTKELLQLMDIYKRRLPLLARTSGDIVEVFLIKHSLICSQFGRFSFASKTFRPEIDMKKEKSPARTIGQDTITLNPQSTGNRTFLRGKYAATKLYQTTRNIIPTNQFEIGVSCGDLLGVIQQKDPMGNRSRWFCDNGVSQGFVDASFLVPLGQTSPESVESEKSKQSESNNEKTPAKSSKSSDESQLLNYREIAKNKEKKPVAVVTPYDEVTEDEYNKPSRKAPPVPNLLRVGLKKINSEQISLHSYEEIAASEANSETHSQDLSPVYEEIPGGSRSSISSSSGSGRSLSSPRGKFYYAMYDFEPEKDEITLIKVIKGQAVRVVQVSGEWWYVEDRIGNRGYVPAAYLRPYQSVPSAKISE